MKNERTVVIDNGSSLIKVGFSGDGQPSLSFPAVVGRYKVPVLIVGMGKKDYYIGEEAFEKQGILCLTHPIEGGFITNWDDMAKIWHHCFFHELRIAPEENPTLLTEAPFNPKANRQRTTQMMFEEFNVPAFYLANQAALAFYSTGKTTGLVLDSGEDATHVVPIHEGRVIPNGILRSSLAGRDLSLYLKQLLSQSGHSFSSSQSEDLRNIKENTCYIALDYEAEAAQPKDKKNRSYELPDGQTIALWSQRFTSPEALFKPKLIDQETPGLHEIVHSSILKCSENIRKDLYSNIVLSGGTTMLPGFAERLKKEVTALASPNTEIKMVTPPQRQNSAWIGGAIFSSLSTFPTMWISKSEYSQIGSQIVHKKCI